MNFKNILFAFSFVITASMTNAEAVKVDKPAVLSADYYALYESELLRAINRPNLRVASTKASENMPGFLEMQIENGPLLYVHPESKQFIDGTLFNYSSGRLVNVTEQKLEGFRKAELAKLDIKDMIVFPAGQAKKHHVYIYTDVDCGYCRKIHEEVPELNARGIEVRYLAYPRAGIGSPTYSKMMSAWCADDQRKALTRLKSDQAIETKTCETPIKEQFELGQRMGVSGTPAIVTAEGRLIPGWMPAQRLIQLLDEQ